MSKCVICNKEFSSEEPKILAMGAYGNPKYMCDDCGSDFEVATLGRDFDEIAAAMDRIGARMANANPDKFTFNTVNKVMLSAGERAKLIKDGDYDFSLDEAEVEEEEGFEDIPEELRETEEDKELDKEDEEKAKKFDKVFNVILTCTIIAAAAVLIWRILDVFVLK